MPSLFLLRKSQRFLFIGALLVSIVSCGSEKLREENSRVSKTSPKLEVLELSREASDGIILAQEFVQDQYISLGRLPTNDEFSQWVSKVDSSRDLNMSVVAGTTTRSEKAYLVLELSSSSRFLYSITDGEFSRLADNGELKSVRVFVEGPDVASVQSEDELLKQLEKVSKDIEKNQREAAEDFYEGGYPSWIPRGVGGRR